MLAAWTCFHCKLLSRCRLSLVCQHVQYYEAVVEMADNPEPTKDGSAKAGGEILAVGRAIRARRKERDLSLRELAQQAGLSVGFLSLVERGQSSLALTSLHSVAKALGTDVASFFASEAAPKEPRVPPASPHVTRADERGQFEIVLDKRAYKGLAPRASDPVLEPLLVTVQPSSAFVEHFGHLGEEFAYVLSGELIYIIDGIEYRLRAGDSIHLKSRSPHDIRNDTDEPVQVLWVLTPRLL